MVVIFSGVSWATASMSMPPSVDATIATRPVAAVDQQGEIIFLRDVDPVGDVEPVDLLALGAGLDGDEGLAEHLLGVGSDLVDRSGQPNAALGIGAEFLELALAAAAGVDLRLDDPERSGELPGRGHRFLDGKGGVAGGDRDALLGEQFLGLIFMDVHGRALKHRGEGIPSQRNIMSRCRLEASPCRRPSSTG